MAPFEFAGPLPGPRENESLQKICEVVGGIAAYEANKRILLTAENLACPFCADGHRLHRHGEYERYALLPDPEEPRRISVQRLLCPQVGRTVSLLPDFCLPRRQHGPAILGCFLEGLLIQGLTLLGALRRVRRDAPGHSVAQTLRNGFIRREEIVSRYVTRIDVARGGTHRNIPAATERPDKLIRGLIQGFDEIGRAFVHHGRHFHSLFQLGLA